MLIGSDYGERSDYRRITRHAGGDSAINVSKKPTEATFKNRNIESEWDFRIINLICLFK